MGSLSTLREKVAKNQLLFKHSQWMEPPPPKAAGPTCGGNYFLEGDFVFCELSGLWEPPCSGSALWNSTGEPTCPSRQPVHSSKADNSMNLFKVQQTWTLILSGSPWIPFWTIILLRLLHHSFRENYRYLWGTSSWSIISRFSSMSLHIPIRKKHLTYIVTSLLFCYYFLLLMNWILNATMRFSTVRPSDHMLPLALQWLDQSPLAATGTALQVDIRPLVPLWGQNCSLWQTSPAHHPARGSLKPTRTAREASFRACQDTLMLSLTC